MRVKNLTLCLFLAFLSGGAIARPAPVATIIGFIPKAMIDMTDENACKAFAQRDSILEIRVHGQDIKNLKFVACFPHLQVLNLAYNKIVDLDGIKGATRLKHLSLRGSGIQDASPIHELSNLETLDLSFNSINSFEGLDRLEKLQALDLSGNEARAPWILQSSPGLKYLDISAAQGVELTATDSAITIYH